MLFNKPDPDGSGWDVNNGVIYDYKAENVTVKNFLNVLKGVQDPHVHKTLKSTKDDTVFLYISSNGGNGYVQFPFENLYAKEFMETLSFMHKNQKYKEMIIYLESSMSATMFTNLPENIKIYAVSSTNSVQDSVPVYCYPHNKVKAYRFNTCIAEDFSMNWLYHLVHQGAILDTATFQEQYVYLKEKLNTSLPMQFGDKSVAKSTLASFLGKPIKNDGQTRKRKNPWFSLRNFTGIQERMKERI